jgi:hypothetical protein
MTSALDSATAASSSPTLTISTRRAVAISGRAAVTARQACGLGDQAMIAELLGFGSGRAGDSSTGRPVSSRVHSAISRARLVCRAHRHAVRGADALELGPGPLFLAEPLDLAERLEVDLGYPAAPTGLESFDKSRPAPSLPSCWRRLSD